MTGLRGGLGSAIAGTVAWTAVPAIAGAVGSIALARTLGPYDRGVMAAVLVWPVAIGILGDLGVSYALSHRVARDPGSSSGLWTLAVLLALLSGSGLALAGGLVLPAALGLSRPAAVALGLSLAGVPAVLLTGFATFLLLGGGSLGTSNAVRASGVLLYAVGVLALALAGKGTVFSYVTVWLAAQLLSAGGAAVAVRHRLGAGWRWEPSLLRPVFSFAFQAWASALTFQFAIRADQLLLSLLGAPADLGVYVVGAAVSSAALPFFSALATVTLQRVTAGARPEAGGAEVGRILRVCVVFGVPAILAGILAAGWVVPAVFGRAYAGAVGPSRVLLAAVFFQGLNAILGNALRGLGAAGRETLAEAAGLVLTVALLAALLPGYGAVGAASAVLVARVAVAWFEVRSVSGATGIPVYRLFLRGAA